MGNFVEDTKNDLITFANDSKEFIEKCTKPDKKGTEILTLRVH